MLKGKKLTGIVCIAAVSASLFCGCGDGGKNTIHIAEKPMSEQLILGEMLGMLIENDLDVNVEITKNVGGGTANIQAGMESGEFDLYPEYTGTGWLYVLKKTEIPDENTLYEELKKEYEEKFDFEWVGLYGFNNTFGVLVRQDIVDQYNLKTISDLAKVADKLTFGAGYDYFERDDGYDALCDAYQMSFGDVIEMDPGLKYTALSEGEVDVINIYTTDAQASAADGTVLEDDLSFFEDYYCGTVVRREVLEENPGLEDVLMKMDGLISEEEMSEMNYQIEIEKRDEAEIAEEFLREKGLL